MNRPFHKLMLLTVAAALLAPLALALPAPHGGGLDMRGALFRDDVCMSGGAAEHETLRHMPRLPVASIMQGPALITLVPEGACGFAAAEAACVAVSPFGVDELVRPCVDLYCGRPLSWYDHVFGTPPRRDRWPDSLPYDIAEAVVLAVVDRYEERFAQNDGAVAGQTPIVVRTPGEHPSGSHFTWLTPANDLYFGTNGADYVYGDEGNDCIFGYGGDDHLWGGPGNDEIYGGDGHDSIVGGSHDDRLHGGAGDDTIQGDHTFAVAGQDRIWGGTGNDVLEGDAWLDYGANDTIFGGPGDDLIWGFDGDDLLVGDAGRDEIYGGRGDDDLYGGSGWDDLIGEDGDDYAHGGYDTDWDYCDTETSAMCL